jgi:hypothetical protein
VTLDCEPDGLQSGWVLSGPYGDISGNGDASFNLFDAGQYTVTWAASPFWTGPSGPQVQTVAIGGAITFEGTYTDGPFAAVTAGALGVAGQSRAGTLVDVDEDGDLDIHVVRNGEVDLLLRNDGALGFTDIAAGVIADAGAGTGAAWADLTGDGPPGRLRDAREPGQPAAARRRHRRLHGHDGLRRRQRGTGRRRQLRRLQP